MKAKKLTAAAIAAVIATTGLAGIPTALAYGTEDTLIKYNGVLGTGETSAPVDENAVASNNAWLKSTIAASKIEGSNEDIVSYNATEFKKVLEIEDNASIPACSFDYAVTVPAGTVSATYNTDTKIIETLAVFPGVGADKITYKLENVKENKFDTESNSLYNTTGLTALTSGNGFTLAYAPQTISLPADATASGKSSLKSVDDNVLINNIDAADGLENVDTYYAIKTVQLDFSACGFTEPGIFRYYIQESGSNIGITNDYKVTTEADNCWRTIDVYVEDASYKAATGAANAGKTVNDLRIAGYVMYVGKQDKGPSAAEATPADPTAANLEDGLTSTNPVANGGANGVEVAGAAKSEGIKNLYTTNELTFKKEVTGNQSSKDKFFKFNLKITDAANNKNVGNDDIFIISTDSTQVVIADWATENTKTPNRATVYTKKDIYAANAATAYPASGTLEYRYVTGADLKAGKIFYLQAGQSITIQGLPSGVGYELTEWQDDYTPRVSLLASTETHTYDNKTKDGESAEDITLVTSLEGDNPPSSGVPLNTAKITDTKIIADVDVTFTNERKGTIPTGIALNAAPAIIAFAVLAGGAAFLALKKKEDEE